MWDVGGQDKVRAHTPPRPRRGARSPLGPRFVASATRNLTRVPLPSPLFRVAPVGHYFQNTQGLIFVLDSNDRDRITEARDELHACLTRTSCASPSSGVREQAGSARSHGAARSPTSHPPSARALVHPVLLRDQRGLVEGLDWLSTDVMTAASKVREAAARRRRPDRIRAPGDGSRSTSAARSLGAGGGPGAKATLLWATWGGFCDGGLTGTKTFRFVSTRGAAPPSAALRRGGFRDALHLLRDPVTSSPSSTRPPRGSLTPTAP